MNKPEIDALIISVSSFFISQTALKVGGLIIHKIHGNEVVKELKGLREDFRKFREPKG